MKRTTFNTAKQQREYNRKQTAEHIKIIQKISWSFHNTTGIAFDDLLGEATEAFYTTIRTYKPTKGTKETTWAWWGMRSHLLNYCQRTQRTKMVPLQPVYLEDDDINPHEPSINPMPLFEFMDEFSERKKTILNKVLESPWAYLDKPAKMARGQITKELKEDGWKWQEIWDEMREIKQLMQN